ncbi:hypothetical protein AKJ49_00410 [candidate division MSBL1 archaeon SCGC-AAA382A03]|uniref:CobQ/CobB/MinD/ParA nucleotide binding domain-containing protein n=1 Tax=candidate division MSBL1 archaeon SCGC-AAA382A03 TaxID=1698278 RepID=A0A133VGR4_9EURY|nr:hypothetical protein AKJ49_00410 [candidate division MSBL1 archaeon SCGC-AAA382A03]
MVNIAITGKGGVGKTTIAGILSRFLGGEEYNVLAIDADPDMNLGSVLGVDMSEVTPLSENKELIAERTGSMPGKNMGGGVFKLNPKVDDIADAYGVKAPDKVNLIIMGTVDKGGSGCMCPSDAFLRALLRHLIIGKDDAVVLDMEAGIEHLGRGTAKSVNSLIIVVEPGMKSLKTAQRIKKLAEDIGIPNLGAIINKVRETAESEIIKERLKNMNIPFWGVVPFDENFMKADLKGKSPLDFSPESQGVQAMEKIKNNILRESKDKC